MAQRGEALLRQAISAGKPMFGAKWKETSNADLTVKIKGFDKPLTGTSRSLLAGVYLRETSKGVWEYGVEHPAAKSLEFGHSYKVTDSQQGWLLYHYGVFKKVGSVIKIPARPFKEPVDRQIEKEKKSLWEHHFGNLLRLARV